MPQEMQKEAQIQIMKLRKKGYSFEWIYRAISHKDCSEWQKFGFGLLWTQSYQNQITNLLAAERNQLSDIDVSSISWDSLLEEELSNSDDEESPSGLVNLYSRYGI